MVYGFDQRLLAWDGLGREEHRTRELFDGLVGLYRGSQRSMSNQREPSMI